jgi:uncharacterized membrane protein
MSGKIEKEIVGRRVMFALELGTALAVLLYVGAFVVTGQVGYWYLAPNLLLAYIPLCLTFGLVPSARRSSWKRLTTWLWATAWLAFLPNSFYIISDSVHLTQFAYALDPLFGQVMFAGFAVLGMLAGFVSVRAVHRQIEAVVPRVTSYLVVELVLLAASVGIYLGRSLRLNSWDVLVRPLEVVKDVILVVRNPGGLPMLTIVMFFVVLSVIYAAVWWPLGSERHSSKPN